MAGLNTDLVVVHVPFTGALTANETSLSYPVPFGAEVVEATVHVGTAPTGADAKFDVQVNGTAKSTLTVTAGSQSATNKVIPGVANGTNYIGGEVPNPTPVAEFAAGDLLSVKVTQVGSTVAGSDAVVALVLNRK